MLSKLISVINVLKKFFILLGQRTDYAESILSKSEYINQNSLHIFNKNYKFFMKNLIFMHGSMLLILEIINQNKLI